MARSIYRSFAREAQRVEFVTGDSHEPRTGRRIRRLLDGTSRLPVLDGDHSYEGVKQDFADYTPLVALGAWLRFTTSFPAGPASTATLEVSLASGESSRPGTRRRPNWFRIGTGDRAGSGSFLSRRYGSDMTLRVPRLRARRLGPRAVEL